MTNQEPEFIVDGWVISPSGQFTVMGCCGDAPIRVSDEFDAIFRYRRRKYPEEMGDEPIREGELDASIRIESIQAFGRTLRMLGEGMTGSIVVSGEGIERISRGMVLGMRNGHHERNGS